MKTLLAIGIAIVGVSTPLVTRADERARFVGEMIVYRSLASSTGNSSQTMMSTSSDVVHVLHEVLDGSVHLDMEGATLTWNGEAAPSNSLIQQVTTARVDALAGDEATIRQVTKAEYFEFTEGKWTFGTAEPSPGLTLAVHLTRHPDPREKGVLVNAYSFKCAYIADRAPLPGVSTLNVGKPVIKSIESTGEYHLRNGEWICMRVRVPSQGQLYIFFKVTEAGADPVKKSPTPDQKPN